MNTMWKLMLAGLVALAFAACSEDGEPVDTDTGSDETPDNTDAFDLNTLVNNTYLVAFNVGYWVAPPVATEEIGGYVPQFALQIKTVDTTAGTITGLLGTANEDGSQNLCNGTMEVSGTIDATGVFAFAPVDFEAIITGPEKQTIATIRGFALGGTFANGGDNFIRGILDATLDFRDVACIFTLITDEANRTPEYICDMLSTYDENIPYSCESCPQEPSVFQCSVMQAKTFKSSKVNLNLQPVAASDPSCIQDQSCL